MEAQDAHGFAGVWRQDIPESSPKGHSKKPKELHIKMEGDTLMVTMMGAGTVGKVDVTYQIDGPEVTYTGLDGDEFHMRVKREGDTLVFEGKERERESEHTVHETWTLKNKNEGQVLLDTKNAKDPNEPSHAVIEYERVK